MNEIVITISILFIGYTYFGYPLILWMIGWYSKESEFTEKTDHKVTVLFSAYNEEESVARTLHSIMESNYPRALLNVLVVSDGSTDRTDEIVQSFNNKRVKLIRIQQREGKNRALANVYQQAVGEILVFVDASSIFKQDSVRNLVRHFRDPKIGSVVGAKNIVDTGSSVSKGDGLYWKYESMLRSLESAIGSSWVGVEGGLFAIRKDLLRMNFAPDLAADYAICCNVYEQGYRNRYDRSAIVYELPTIGIDEEFWRKVRVIVRGIRALFAYKHLLNPFIHPGFSFQNTSHRLCRWLVPFFLIALFLASFLSGNVFARFAFYAQSAFYFATIVGIFIKHGGILHKITSIPLYFTTVNTAALIAWFLLWKRFDIWKPTQRERVDNSSGGAATGKT